MELLVVQGRPGRKKETSRSPTWWTDVIINEYPPREMSGNRSTDVENNELSKAKNADEATVTTFIVTTLVTTLDEEEEKLI